jgi:hypothetical protein
MSALIGTPEVPRSLLYPWSSVTCDNLRYLCANDRTQTLNAGICPTEHAMPPLFIQRIAWYTCLQSCPSPCHYCIAYLPLSPQLFAS